MVRNVYMIKVIFVKKKRRKKVIYTKSDEEFKFALSWIMTGNLFLKKTLLLGAMEDVFYLTCPHKILIICLSLIC